MPRAAAAILIAGSTLSLQAQAPPAAQAPSAAQTSPAAPAAGHAAAASNPAAPDDKPVRDMLTRYTAAFNGKNLDALVQIWPSMTPAQLQAVRAELEHARLMKVELVEPRITLKDDTAIVVARRRTLVVRDDGKTFTSATVSTFNLRRITDAWVIEKIVNQL